MLPTSYTPYFYISDSPPHSSFHLSRVLRLSGKEESNLRQRLPKHKTLCCKLPVLDALKNTSCCHYTIPQRLWSLSISAPFPLNLRRYELNDHLFAYRIRTCASRFTRACFRYTKPILRSIVPTHYLPCTAFFFGIVQRQLITLCRCFRGAGNRNRTDISSLEG